MTLAICFNQFSRRPFSSEGNLLSLPDYSLECVIGFLLKDTLGGGRCLFRADNLFQCVKLLPRSSEGNLQIFPVSLLLGDIGYLREKKSGDQKTGNYIF